MNAETGGRKQPGALQGLLLILGSTLGVMAVVVLAPVLPEMVVAFGDMPNASLRVPALISVVGLGAAVFAPFAGLIGDRFGRRLPLIGFCIAFSVVGTLPIFLNDFTSIFLTRVAVGIAHMGVLVISTAMIGDYFSGESRVRWLAAQAMIVSCSALVLLPVGGLFGAWFGWRGPFLIFLAAAPLAIAYWTSCPEPDASSDDSDSHVPWSALPWPWLTGVCLLSVFMAVLFFAVQLQVGLALTVVGITDAARIGLLSGVVMAGIPLGALLFVRVSAYPFARLLFIELLIAGVTLMMMRYAEDYRLFLLVVFANLTACGMMLPTLLTHVSGRLDGAVRARGIGIWQGAFSAGLFLSVEISGLVTQRPGTTVLDAFWVLGVSGIVAAAITWLTIVIRRTLGLSASRVEV